MFKKFLMGLVCLSLVAMVGCGGGGGGGKSNPTQDMKEALKGKWYAHSYLDVNNNKPEFYFYSSDDDKASYIEIKEDNKYERFSYGYEDNGVFKSVPPTHTIGTWKFEDNILVLHSGIEDYTYTVKLQNEILSMTVDGFVSKFKKTPPAKYPAPAISEEELKGKWYAHSFIPKNGQEYNCYSSNDDKYYYLEIKEDNKYKFVAYDHNSIGIFIGDPFIYEGTWQFENPKLILTDNNKDTPIDIYNISLQDGILTTTHETYGDSAKLKKTPTPKYE